MRRSKPLLIGLVILAVSLLGLPMLFGRSRKSNNPNNLEPGQVPKIILDKIQAAGYGFTIAQNWVYVSKMETAGWTSTGFKTRNNLWGMKTPQKRQTTAVNKGTSETWAVYDSVEDSAQDIVLYMNEFNYPTNVENLADLIAVMKQKNYFGTESFESYLNKVIAWIEK